MKEKSADYKEVVSISMKLNEYLDGYYSETIIIKNLLNHEDDEEVVFKIQNNIDKRELIMNQYNIIKQQYDKLEKLVDMEQAKTLNDLKLTRNQIIKKIGEIDSENMIKLNKLYNTQQSNIKKINDGKRMHNAYERKHSTPWGVFIDKKE